jgi:hypothetical protein
MFNTPSSNHSVLAALRANPLAAFEKYGFVVQSETYLQGDSGGPCIIECSNHNDNIYLLRAKDRAGGDWYYPYITSGTSVGRCRVPVGQPDGTLVVTGGMNGCATQVNRVDGGFFEFHHDKNSCSIAKLPHLLPGRVVCHIGYEDYAGPNERLQQNIVADAASRGVMTAHEHYVIAVKAKGRWHMFNSSILRNMTGGKKLSFQTYRPTITPLITTFDDA